MDPVTFIKSVCLAVPLFFILQALPLPIKLAPAYRLPLAAAISWLGALGLLSLLPSGTLAYLVSFAIMASIYAVLALGLNVQWGYTGLFNIGVAAFFSIGAFTSALFTTAMPEGLLAQYSRQAFGLEQPFFVGVLAAGLISGIVALLIGIPTLKLREDYLAIATIGIAELVRLIFQNERWLANGPQPLRGIPRPLYCLVETPPCAWLPGPLQTLFSALHPRDYTYIYLVIVSLFVVFVYFAIERAIRSPWGRVLRAIREEEDSTAMSGKDIFAFKMQAFVVGAIIMGMGGALYAHYMVSIDYGHFIPLYGTFLIWVMLMLGGSGNSTGAILGAFVIWGVWSGTAFLADAMRPLLAAIAPELPGRAPYLRFMLIAILLELILLYRPQGLLGEERVVSQLAEER